jgi:hypothetical protein
VLTDETTCHAEPVAQRPTTPPGPRRFITPFVVPSDAARIEAPLAVLKNWCEPVVVVAKPI